MSCFARRIKKKRRSKVNRSKAGYTYYGVWAILIVLLSASCQTLKHVPEEQKLYGGAEVRLTSEQSIHKRGEVEAELRETVRPKPNKKAGGQRFGLWARYKVERGDSGAIMRKLNDKFGERPVYFKESDIERTKKLLKNRLFNRGYFHAIVNAEVIEKKNIVYVEYNVHVTRGYKMEDFQYQAEGSPLDSLIEASLENSLIEKGNQYNLETFRRERERIERWLKDKGYYGFRGEYLLFSTDTNHYDDRRYDLYLSLKEGVPDRATRPYKIKKVIVKPNYSVQDDTSKAINEVEGIIFQGDANEAFKRKHLITYLDVAPGQLYSEESKMNTIRRLNGIGSFQYVSVRYEVLDTITKSGRGLLQCNIFLSPAKKQSVSAEMRGVTKSNGFAGPGLSLTYGNKNIFRGGEVLNNTINGSYEAQISDRETQGLASYQLDLQNSLTVPRLIAPGRHMFKPGYSVPKTRFELNYSMLNRMRFYYLNTFFFSYGFQWRSSSRVQHELSPVAVNYANLSRTTPDFEAILDNNPYLRNSLSSQFIPGITYMVRYSELQTNKRNRFYIEYGIDISGNSVSLVREMTGGPQTVFGVPYAQYVKNDIDIRYYRNVGEKSRLTARFQAGVGYAYGNSTGLPYIKQYFAGGPNSIRAFRVRSLGPGTYRPPHTFNSFFDQSGDIKLESTVEYRFPLFSYLKGAVFADAGNIWLLQEQENLEGGEFTDEWYDQLAMGAGVGMRVDLDFFVLRLDVAFPVRYPETQPNGTNWQDDYTFWNDRWIGRNLVWNFAFGYPF